MKGNTTKNLKSIIFHIIKFHTVTLGRKNKLSFYAVFWQEATAERKYDSKIRNDRSKIHFELLT